MKFLPDSLMPFKTELPQVRFPSIQELLEAERTGVTSNPLISLTNVKPVKKGLFEEFLGNDPSPIYQDSLDHPEKYTEEAKNLLVEVVGHKRELTDKEKDTLNAATLEFMSYTPPQKAKAPTTSAPLPKKQSVSMPAEDLPTRGVDIPEDSAPLFWWR